MVERLGTLDGELEGASAESHRELVKEADLAEQDLPGSRSPLAEEPDLGLPFHTGQPWFRSEPKCHISRMDEPLLAADLQRSGMIPVRSHSNLSCYAGRSKHTLSAGVHQGKERGLLGSLWPLSAYEGDVHHWSVDVSPRWMRFTTCRILDIGEHPREGALLSQCRGLPESNQLCLVLLLCGNPEHAGITDSLGT
jgi:hypothetical protein